MAALAITLVLPDAGEAQSLSCFPAKTCGQMANCAEAYFHYSQCGSTARDGDGDGIPCENVCGKTLAIMRERLRAQGYDPGQAGQGLLKTPRTTDFSCTPTKTCGQMVSCEEAMFQLRKCGNRRLDANHDGIPCNSLCR